MYKTPQYKRKIKVYYIKINDTNNNIISTNNIKL